MKRELKKNEACKKPHKRAKRTVPLHRNFKNQIMKKSLIAIFFTVVVILGWSVVPASINNDNEALSIKRNYATEEYLWNRYYNETIEYIKKHEGFNNGMQYICAAGQPTIGYGHVILEHETFNEPISKKTADSLLRVDFNKALKSVERNTNLTGLQKLAIAHFVFSVGTGNFYRSELKKRINNNEPIDNHLLEWAYYTRNGKKFHSRHALKIRQWELKLYNEGAKTFIGR